MTARAELLAERHELGLPEVDEGITDRDLALETLQAIGIDVYAPNSRWVGDHRPIRDLPDGELLARALRSARCPRTFNYREMA